MAEAIKKERNMVKRLLVISGGVAIAVALPVAGLALTTGADSSEPVPATYSELEAGAAQAQPAQNTTYEPQRLRVHAETGPPDGVEPVMRRLHQNDAVRNGEGSMNRGSGIHQSQNRANRQAASANGFGMHRGNPDAPIGGGSGECAHDGECVREDGPLGSGPRGPANNSG